MVSIQALPINREGDLLFLKGFRKENDKFFISYRAMTNDIPFTETEIFSVDNGSAFVITGDNGIIIYRIPTQYVINLG